MSQLTFLGYLNKEATQDVTIHCRLTPVWFDGRSDQKNYNKAMIFRGMEEQEYGPESSEGRLIGEVVGGKANDECQYMTNSWKKTVLRFNSRKFIRLPITDFAPHRDTDSNAMFGMDLGPVCFKN